MCTGLWMKKNRRTEGEDKVVKSFVKKKLGEAKAH
jgi:hypothetical protein